MNEVKEYVNARFEELKKIEVEKYETELAQFIAELAKMNRIRKSVNYIRKVRKELALA